jgi:sugar phosphate isomerase/epimerase
MWERAVRWWTAAPGALLEPWAGAVVNSIDAVRAFRAEVPELRLLVDTGHVADWGGDPCALLELADHVQLRQGKPGHTQVHVDDPSGAVDFSAVLGRLDELDYRGRLSVEYFDLPENGWPLEDPESWARDLAAHLRGLGV